MARKTNKTDHVLNLLSTGSKKNGKEERDAAPVQLHKPGGDAEPASQQETEAADLPDLPEDYKAAPAEELPDLPDLPEGGEKTAKQEPLPDIPEVSVVHAEGEENPIADAVKESLEAELEAFLEEDSAEPPAADSSLPDLPDETESPSLETEPEPQAVPVPEAAEPPQAPAAESEEAAPQQEEELPDLTDSMQQEEAQELPDIEPVQQESPAEESQPASEAPQPQEPGEVPDPAVQSMIEDALKADAEKQAAEEPAAPAQEEPEPAESSQEEPAQPQEPAAEAAPEKEPPAAPAPQPEEPKSVAEAAAQAGTAEEERDYAVINVMEHLVRNQVTSYIQQFGHCDCPRCIEDTVALALTHLPAKYVVVNKHAVSPLLNFYEKKFAGQIIVEITKASMIVNETPHHNR